jgi:hypothetical protein
MAARITPIVIALIFLGAHFLRSHQPLVVIICLLSPLLLLIRRRWVLLLLQFLAYFGGVVWISTIVTIAQNRITHGLPWARMAVILGAVALFTILSGLLLNSSKVKKKYVKK